MEKKKRSRKTRRRVLRRLIPVAAALILIVIVAAIAFGSGLLEQYAYSTKQADLYEYFGLTSDTEAAIMLDNEYIDEKARVEDGKYYLPMDLVEEYFFDDFYYDEKNDCLLYTYATGTDVSKDGDGNFLKRGEQVYLNVDYVKQFAPMEVKLYEDPAHMELKYSWDSVQLADIKKNTKARILGGVKSDILTSLSAGDTVEILNPMETWCQVKTPDGYLGYVENKYLDNYREEQQTAPVCEKSNDITHTLRDHKICMGWHQVMSAAAALDGLDQVTANAKGMNVISPTWFSLSDNTGNISDISSAEYVTRAHAKNLEVWALVDNFNDSISTTEVLTDTDKRQTLINNLVQATLSVGADGINVDFEELPDSCGEAFAQFIRELSIPCRSNSLVLSVDNYVPRGYTAHYDRKTQGEYADYVIIMGYDEHYAGSAESGSVASFSFVQDGIVKTLEDVPANQVINGIPFYTRIWYEGSELTSEAVGMQTAKDFVAAHDIITSWDDECAQNYGETQVDGKTTKIWLEDVESISAKLNLMDANNIAGVACWKLGMETDDVWDVISSYVSD